MTPGMTQVAASDGLLLSGQVSVCKHLGKVLFKVLFFKTIFSNCYCQFAVKFSCLVFCCCFLFFVFVVVLLFGFLSLLLLRRSYPGASKSYVHMIFF